VRVVMVMGVAVGVVVFSWHGGLLGGVWRALEWAI
jgi:hypothetical protein